MGRKAAYHVRLADGREVGFGLVLRCGDTYSVQFADLSGKSLIRSTRETARPRAIAAAERIVRDHWEPKPAPGVGVTWDELLIELERHLTADGARPATVSDYLDTLRQVRSAAPSPAAVTVEAAQRWCNEYLGGTFRRGKGEGAKTYSRSPRTLHARARKLQAIWNKYLIRRMKLVPTNPWESVDLPRLDRLPIRTLSRDRVGDFFMWVDARWPGWALPRLFWEVKSWTGCRLGDLCALRPTDLTGDRLTFLAGTAKARRQRVAVLPADIADALRRLAGPSYLWERYSTEIVHHLKIRGVPTHRVNPVFSPRRLAWWAKDEIDDFNKAHPDRPKIQSHDFRKRAVTEAHRAGLDVDTAAAAVGMSAATARSYYLAIDQEKAAVEMAAKMASTLRPPRRAGGDEPAPSEG